MGAVTAGVLLPGCAIGLSGANGQSTRLTFTVNLNGPIAVANQYIYAIVMNLAQGSASPPLTSPANGIAPVVGPGSLNYMFVGLATNALIIFNVANSGNPVGIYNYGQTPVDSGNFALPAVSGTTIDQLPPPDINGDIPGTLTFTVFLNQLQPVETQLYQWIQFQVLTMNKTTLSGSSGRGFDALGVSPNFQETPWLSIASSISYGANLLYPEGLTGTPSGSDSDPALSIQSVTLNVSVP